MDRNSDFSLRKSSCLALLFFLLAQAALFGRVWTDRQGRHVDAQFVRLRGDSVVLQKGLKPLTIPLKEFCDEDQEYLKELTKGKGVTKPATVEKKGEAAKDSAATPSALKPNVANQENPFLTGEDESAEAKTTEKENPFLTDVEKTAGERKTAGEDSGKEAIQPKLVKDEPPKVNAEGRFDERTWTDRKSNKLTANFVRLDGKMVVLSTDGKEERYPLDEFCYNDKLYIRQAALELKKYQKFAGNQANMLAQNVPPAQSTAPAASAMPGGVGMNAGSPFSGMQQSMAQQQADAARRSQEMLAQQQTHAQQLITPAQDALAQHHQMLEQIHQGQAETQRQLDEQRRITQEQVRPSAEAMPQLPPPMPQVPVSSPADSAPSAFSAKICMSCKGTVANSSKAGDRCPHCGVLWDVEEDEHGREIGWSWKARASGIGGLVVALSAAISGLVRYLRRHDS